MTLPRTPRGGRQNFLADRKTQDAILRKIEVMGEATKRLSSKLRQKYPD